MTTAPTCNDTATVGAADRHAALLAAYIAHMAETGRRPGVRALRERARTSTDTAAAWLKEHAPERQPPKIPAESLEPILAPLWAAAVDAATQTLRAQHNADITERTVSEAQALRDAEQAQQQVRQQADRAADAETRSEALAREIVTAQQEVHRARAQAHEASEAAAEHRERAQAAIHEAQQDAAVARAEAAALREALAAVRPTTYPTQEKS